MSEQSHKIIVDPILGNALIAVTHDRNLPFDIEVGGEFEDGDMQLLVTTEDSELLSQTLTDLINNMI